MTKNNRASRFGLITGKAMITALCVSTLVINAINAQDKRPRVPVDKNTPALASPQLQDTSAMRKKPAASPGSLKPYSEIIPSSAVTQKGMITVHKVEDKWFFEIPDTLLNTEIMIVNRIAKAAADCQSSMPMMGFGGDEINKDVVKLERGPNNKLFIRSMSYSIMAKDSTAPMYQSIMNSYVQPIVLSLDIKTEGKKSVVVEMTDLLKGDEPMFSFNPVTKKVVKAGGIQSDKSYIIGVKSFPLNTEIRSIKTYSRSAGTGAGAVSEKDAASTVTFEVNSSIVMLPRVPMKPRYYDERVGFFSNSYTDFNADPQRVKTSSIIVRWRLEPKPQDIERFKRGELVEPQKPIVYYIDPATPKQWVPYLMKAVNDWQPAFEQAGFKNAIIAKLAPTPQEDSTFSLEDARHSAILYLASDIPNGMGLNVNDPRSGEIIESHIKIYHNILTLIHDWYMIQAGPSDPAARKMEFDDELMGTLLYTVVAHEVGHAIGLRHNWGASFATPVEKLRDNAWLKQYGHTSSIMDYARFNYVAQPEDKVSREGLMPRINDYDKWAIEWGYKPIPDATPEQEKKILNSWVVEKTKNPRLRFLSGENKEGDPRSLSEDLSDNVMKANEYGIKNLQYVIKNLPSWVNESGENYETLASIHTTVVTQYRRYLAGHVLKFIGGVYVDTRTSDQPGPIYQVVPKSMQKEAVAFIAEHAFKKPSWLFDKNIADKILRPNIDPIMMYSDGLLGQMLGISTLNDILNNAESYPKDAYTLVEYLNDVKKGLYGELKTNQPIDAYRRILQKSYVIRLGEFASLKSKQNSATTNKGFEATRNDVSSVSKAMLTSLQSEITAALPLQKDEMSLYHLKDLKERIISFLKGGDSDGGTTGGGDN